MRIYGYDINGYNVNVDGNQVIITGIAHLEHGTQTADIPFEGRHEKGMTGFIEFGFKTSNEIDVEEIRKASDVIRDTLAEHLIKNGYEPGEYLDIIPIDMNEADL